LKVLTGLYAPSTGSVLFNKISIDTIPSQQLAQHLSVVEQDILLFSGSIRDNLSLWRPAITEEVMIAALQLVELWDDILPRDGLDCIVLEGGSNFSQGQKQRLEIARALCIESKVLILDESTSGLNQDMESRILKRLFNKSITIILITHRLTVIKPCDRIVLMNNGAINAIGTHAHLLQESEIYRQLMELE
ncbi:MAG: ATP-binding cassette domain-containing protein, partial [Gammaproteobacteria bacterium]|nr:ATP-binding cassette domain-containing protein [Gammaproteobacteria bacterium]